MVFLEAIKGADTIEWNADVNNGFAAVNDSSRTGKRETVGANGAASCLN